MIEYLHWSTSGFYRCPNQNMVLMDRSTLYRLILL
jgi:hypothetical protein